MNDLAVQVENLSKRYRLGERQSGNTLREVLSDWVASGLRNRTQGVERDEFWALQDVSFDVKKGEVIGIVGSNGAGKSTLLKILSRITEPTSGHACVYGRVGSLLEVGTGFHPELTGRENVYLNGAILGMKRSEIESKFDDIIEFADVERFVDTPVKHYSSGMYVRLAFSVAAHLDPEILILDEVLAVGDASFQRRCLDHFKLMKESGKTILLISHNLSVVGRICDTALLLDGGRLIKRGSPDDVIAEYRAGIEQRLTSNELEKLQREDPERWGNGAARILSVSTESSGRPTRVLRDEAEIRFKIEFESYRNLEDVIVGLAIHDSSGRLFFATNSSELKCKVGPVAPGTVYGATFTCDNVFSDGIYDVSCAVNDTRRRPYARLEKAFGFEVRGRTTFSPVWPQHSFLIEAARSG